MTFKDRINQEVENKTGMDVPELSGKNKLSRKQILNILRQHKKWIEDHVTDDIAAVDRIIRDNFTEEEIGG